MMCYMATIPDTETSQEESAEQPPARAAPTERPPELTTRSIVEAVLSLSEATLAPEVGEPTGGAVRVALSGGMATGPSAGPERGRGGDGNPE